MKLIYIHGFGSSGLGHKAQQLKAFCQAASQPPADTAPGDAPDFCTVMAPSLPQIPDLAIDTLSALIEALQPHEPVGLIGSSLGGFYAIYLSAHYQVPAVLVNPAVQAPRLLAQAEGMCSHFYDQSQFEWTSTHTQSLHRFQVAEPPVDRLRVMLQQGDEVLDADWAVSELAGADFVIEPGGDHSFQGFEHHLADLLQFLRSKHSPSLACQRRTATSELSQ